MKKIIIVILFALTGILYFWFRGQDVPYSKIQTEEVFGIDVSKHQETIDWQKVSQAKYITFFQRKTNNTSKKITKNNKVEFCFIKATEGATYIDPKFKQNLHGCIKYKIPRTGYHYFRFKSDPQKQARNFINNVPKSQLSIPPAVDLEYKDNNLLLPSEIAKNPSIKAAFVQKLTILSNELEKHYGQKPIFYTSTAFYGALIKGNFSDHSIWIQDLRPVISPDFDWLFWQISLRGQIEGITANFVDINIFNGNKSDFHNYLKN